MLKKLANRFNWARVPSDKKEARLEVLRGYADSSLLSRPLLALADQDNVPIRFNPDLCGTKTNGHVNYCKDGSYAIELNPEASDADLQETLVHELRHYWQIKHLGLTRETKINLARDPRMELLTNRVMEADAFSYSMMVRQDIAETAMMRRGVLRELQKFANEIGKKPDSLNIDDINAFNKKNNALSFDSQVENIGKEFFTRILGLLGGYDDTSAKLIIAENLALVFRRASNDNGHPVTIEKLRAIPKRGTDDKSPLYFKTESAKDFEQTILSAVNVEILKLADTVTAYKSCTDDSKKPDLNWTALKQARTVLRQAKTRK